MIFIWIIILLLLIAFFTSDSGKVITAIGVISIAIFLIAKLTGFSILDQIPKWGVVAIIVIVAGVILTAIFRD